MSHRKGYKKDYICQLSKHYEDHMLCTAAMQSGPLQTRAARQASSVGALLGEAAEQGQEALGGLLLLKSPFCGRSQHPPTQGHRVGGRAFRGQAAL